MPSSDPVPWAPSLASVLLSISPATPRRWSVNVLCQLLAGRQPHHPRAVQNGTLQPWGDEEWTCWLPPSLSWREAVG